MLTTLRIVREEEKAQLRVLLTSCLRELSQYGETNFEYPYFSSYWNDEHRWPYFIENGENVVGFVLVNTCSPSQKGTDFGLAEFYILPDFRGKGIGKRAFTALPGLHPGRWELSVMTDNEAAKEFWGRKICASNVAKIEIYELEEMLIYCFSTLNA